MTPQTRFHLIAAFPDAVGFSCQAFVGRVAGAVIRQKLAVGSWSSSPVAILNFPIWNPPVRGSLNVRLYLRLFLVSSHLVAACRTHINSSNSNSSNSNNSNIYSSNSNIIADIANASGIFGP